MCWTSSSASAHERRLKDTLRLLLKLLSTGFPKEFDVAVILEGLQSDLDQVHSAIQVRRCRIKEWLRPADTDVCVC